MVTGSANAACGSATPSGLLIRSRLRTRMNSGRIATVRGNSSPMVKNVYTPSRPRNR